MKVRPYFLEHKPSAAELKFREELKRKFLNRCVVKRRASYENH